MNTDVYDESMVKKRWWVKSQWNKKLDIKRVIYKIREISIKKRDILMCMTDMKGNVALLGHTALVYEENKYIVNQRVGLLRIKNSFNIDKLYSHALELKLTNENFNRNWLFTYEILNKNDLPDIWKKIKKANITFVCPDFGKHPPFKTYEWYVTRACGIKQNMHL